MNKEMVPIKLEGLIDFKNGKIASKKIGAIPIYGGNGILGYTDESNYENVLIIGRVGAYCGSVHIEKGKCWVSDNAIAGVHKQIESNEYNYYLLRCISLNKKQIGSSQPLLTQGILNRIDVNIYSDVILRAKIASVLSSLDSKIELNNRINAELEAMAKTLYDYWFVQFDFPIYNQDGTLSGAEGYKTSGGKMVWNEELKREIPQGWEVKKIGKILKTSLGGTPSTKVKEYWENGKISWLNSGEIANFPIIDSELKITEAAIKNSATDLLPKGSVMLSITRHLRPSILGIDACANQSVVGILEKGDIKCYFLYPYLQNEIPRLMEMRSGAQQPHINKEIVDESLILLPNNETDILKNYNSVVGHLYESIINKAFQNQKLTKLRDWLLPMLMNGQVKVN